MTKAKAVLDIGSNTIRLLIADVSTAPHKRIHYQHQIARLGEGLQKTGRLSDAGKARAMLVFQEVVKVCHSFGIAAEDIRAVATAAMRDAANGATFVAEVAEKTGLNIQIIGGEMEANLALTGAQSGLPLNVSEQMLLFDIGGGSTEFSRIIDGQLVDNISVKLGVVRLTEGIILTEPPSTQNYEDLCNAANVLLDEVEDFWGDSFTLPQYLVGTAGTVTTLAAIAQHMKVYDPELINNYEMTRSKFNEVKANLLSKTNAERLQICDLEAGREDVIIAGVAIVEMMFQRWSFPALVSVDSGLLEGLLH